MVGNPRRTPDSRRIRRLNSPAAIEVEADSDGVPLRVRAGGWQDVRLLREPWRIDQHWWRTEAIRRTYYRVAFEDGRPLTIYSDLTSGHWFSQAYS